MASPGSAVCRDRFVHFFPVLTCNQSLNADFQRWLYAKLRTITYCDQPYFETFEEIRKCWSAIWLGKRFSLLSGKEIWTMKTKVEERHIIHLSNFHLDETGHVDKDADERWVIELLEPHSPLKSSPEDWMICLARKDAEEVTSLSGSGSWIVLPLLSLLFTYFFDVTV
jgi:hypothetical protein